MLKKPECLQLWLIVFCAWIAWATRTKTEIGKQSSAAHLIEQIACMFLNWSTRTRSLYWITDPLSTVSSIFSVSRVLYAVCAICSCCKMSSATLHTAFRDFNVSYVLDFWTRTQTNPDLPIPSNTCMILQDLQCLHKLSTMRSAIALHLLQHVSTSLWFSSACGASRCFEPISTSHVPSTISGGDMRWHKKTLAENS